MRWVFHLQANADVRHGLEHPRRDLEQNTLATAGVLEAMRAHGVRRIVFASTGSVYGEPEVFPTPEDAYRALRRDPGRLRVPGDGRQEKFYLYVQDCLDAMLLAAAHHAGRGARTCTTSARRKQSWWTSRCG